ncbi:MAG: hypothetical protein ACLFT3_15220 [Cyclobacteriaceae bacterium]
MKTFIKFQQLISLLLLLIVAVACEEEGGDDPGPEPEPDRREIVTQSWGVDDVVADGASQGAQNVQVNFTEGGQYTLRIPGLEGLGNSGTWEFNSDESAIILDDGSLEVIAEIVSISEEQMVLRFDFENYKGNITTYRITLTA